MPLEEALHSLSSFAVYADTSPPANDQPGCGTLPAKHITGEDGSMLGCCSPANFTSFDLCLFKYKWKAAPSKHALPLPCWCQSLLELLWKAHCMKHFTLKLRPSEAAFCKLISRSYINDQDPTRIRRNGPKRVGQVVAGCILAAKRELFCLTCVFRSGRY